MRNILMARSSVYTNLLHKQFLYLNVFSRNSRKSQTTRGTSSLPSVIKTWTCFSTSAYSPLAPHLSTNQIQTFFHLFLFCGPGLFLNALLTSSRCMFLSDKSIPPLTLVCFKSHQSKKKVIPPDARQGHTVWNKLPHNMSHASSINSFKTALKKKNIHQQNM